MQMVAEITPVLNLINPELPPTEPRAPQLGVIDKCQRTWGWLQQFVKDVGEYAGAHVLSMVHAYYPLMDFMHFEKGYPKDVGPKKAEKL